MGALQQIIATDPRAAQQAAAVLKTKGKGSDTELAHINPRELRILRKASGRAVDGSEDDINPATGVPMFDDSDDDGNSGNTSNAGENTGGMDGSAASGSGPGSGPSSSSGGDSSGQGIGGGIGYGGDVGFSPGNRPDGFRSEDTINETETSAASRAGTSTADDYAGMGPEKAAAYGLGWNEYSEQTTGLQGFLNQALGINVKGPTAATPNPSWSYDVNPVGMIAGALIGGPIGSLAAKAATALGAPGSVSVAGGQYASEIGHNMAPTSTEVADAMGNIGIDGSMVTNSEAGVTGPDTTNGNNSGEGAFAGRTTVAGTTPADQADDLGGLDGTWDPNRRNLDRSSEAAKYINDLRQRWGFDQMKGSALSNIVAGAGQFGDTKVAMLSPEAQARLKAAGGVGSRNPATGMPQFYAAADVAKAYKEVLGREGEAAGIANWTQTNPNGTYQDLVNEFKKSGEYKTNQINSAYQSNLGRTAETEGLNNWMKQWDAASAAGQDPYASINSGIANSAEAQAYKAKPPAATTPTTPAPTTPAPTTPAPTTPPAATPAPQVPDYASFMKDFMTQLQGILKPAATTPAATTPAATPATTSPLQNVSTLTPVRVPRFRSRRYAGYIAPNFSS